MASLAERVQDLPPELSDEIYELTFTLDDEVTVSEDFKLPSQLQVDRTTRAKLLDVFYRCTAFVIHEKHQRHAGKWFQSLVEDHRHSVTAIKFKPHKVYWEDREIDLSLANDVLDRLSIWDCCYNPWDSHQIIDIHLWRMHPDGKREKSWVRWDAIRKTLRDTGNLNRHGY